MLRCLNIESRRNTIGRQRRSILLLRLLPITNTSPGRSWSCRELIIGRIFTAGRMHSADMVLISRADMDATAVRITVAVGELNTARDLCRLKVTQSNCVTSKHAGQTFD